MKKIFNYLEKLGIDEAIVDFKKKKVINFSAMDSDGNQIPIRTDIKEAIIASAENLLTNTAKLSTVRVYPQDAKITSEIFF